MEGEITGFSAGKGILKKDGLVVFIPFTAVGDRVQYQIIKQKKKYAEGELLSIEMKGPHRILPRCPYFTRCGGCQVQHIDYPAQLENKRIGIIETLKRIGNVSIENLTIEPASSQWAYRRTISLQIKMAKNNNYEAGYIAVDNHTLVPISECQIFCEKEDPLFEQIQKTVKRLSGTDGTPGKLILVKQPDGFIFKLHFSTIPKNAPQVFKDAMQRYPKWLGVSIQGPRGKEISFGKQLAVEQIAGLTISYSPSSFIQNHPEQSSKIYQLIEKIAEMLAPKKALDLYSGVGITSLILARLKIRTLGIEINPDAVKLAKANALQNGIEQVSFICGNAEKNAKAFLLREKPELVIVNPPREGMDIQLTKCLCELKPPAIIYVSCSPATLARDLKQLLLAGYKITQGQAFDMFPQTEHVETLVQLSLPCGTFSSNGFLGTLSHHLHG